MALLLNVLVADQHTSKKCYGCQEGSESHKNITLEMSSLRVMVKNSRGKKQQEETEKHQYVVMTENNLFKSFTTKNVRNYDWK